MCVDVQTPAFIPATHSGETGNTGLIKSVSVQASWTRTGHHRHQGRLKSNRQ